MRRLGRLLQRRQEHIASRRALDSDPLTGLLNRHSFSRHANAILESLVPEVPVAVFMLDVDHFKRINDQFGHSAGDKVLIAIGTLLAATLGEATPVFRLGGEEFGWIANGRWPEDLDALALCVLEALRKQEIGITEGRSMRVTASIGWTRLVRGMTLQEAMHEADNAMYEAKARGRDCVRSWDALCSSAAAADADIQLVHFQNVAKVVNERATNLVTLFGKDLVEKARRAADEDRLTQIWNRGYFDRRLAREFEMSKRDGRHLSIVMMDLDHFGQFNKVHGLPTGDAVLRRFTAVAASCIRVIDWFARYGGEEFALVLPGTLEEAAVVAERIRAAVEATEIDAPHGKTVRVTVSLGIAALEPADAEPVDLVQRVSDALQTAKRNGRNRVAA
jgi:diguanylate cyclase (GGDEF)-like protein